MVLETLAVGMVSTGLASVCAWARAELAPRYRALRYHHDAPARLDKSVAQGRPCPQCDLSSLRHLNAKNHKVSCVTVTLDMPACCERCSSLKLRLIERYAPNVAYVATVPMVTVSVEVPMTTYGLTQRSVEAAMVGEKGSQSRATGTFMHHLSGLRVPEADKIAMMRWLPHLLGQAFANRAKVQFPPAPGDYAGKLTFDEICDHLRQPKRDQYAEAHKRIHRRLRKLKRDEQLTDEARQILRFNKDERARKIQALVATHETDDIFSLGLVKLIPIDPSKIAFTDQQCGLSECSEDSIIEMPDDNDENQSREAEVSPDAVEAEMINVGNDDGDCREPESLGNTGDLTHPDIATEEPSAQVDEIQINRDELLSLRTSDTIDLGYLVGKPKRIRRDRLVASRGQ